MGLIVALALCGVVFIVVGAYTTNEALQLYPIGWIYGVAVGVLVQIIGLIFVALPIIHHAHKPEEDSHDRCPRCGVPYRRN